MTRLYYIYKITRQDGAFYIGMHSTRNLDDDYMGSGKRISASIKKHGVDYHSKEILTFASSREELLRLEAEHITDDLLKDPMCMNLKLGGDGGWDHIDWAKRKHSPESIDKMKRTQKARWTEELKKQWSVKQTGAGNAHYGHAHSEETKTRMSEAQRGKPKVLSDAARARIGERLGNLHRGKPKSEETKAKMAAARKKYWAAKNGSKAEAPPK